MGEDLGPVNTGSEDHQYHSVLSTLTVFMDGSKIDTPTVRGTGWAFIFYRTDPSSPPQEQLINPFCTSYFSTCNIKSVFLAEVMAITSAMSHFVALVKSHQLPPPLRVEIHSESLSSLLALGATMVHSMEVLNCIRTLNQASSISEVHLYWVKAHVGHRGNKLADSLAKLGASKPPLVLGLGLHDSVPLSFIKQVLCGNTRDEWTETWITVEPCRQTKFFFPRPDPQVSS